MKRSPRRASEPTPKLGKAASNGYSGTPLVQKLGVRAEATVGLVGAPLGFEALLEPLPHGAKLVRSARARCDLWIWFPRSASELEKQIANRTERLGAHGIIWICWPKKSSGVASDLDEHRVRNAGLAAGLVDFKVCAVDATYSGLKLTFRKG